MIYSGKAISMAALTVVCVTNMLGCGSGTAVPSIYAPNQLAASGGPSGSTQACDGIRRHVRAKAIKGFGLDHLTTAMKPISNEINKDEREDLARFTTAIDTVGIDSQLRDESIRLIQSIYNSAIDRSGVHHGMSEVTGEKPQASKDGAVIAEPQKFVITTEPTGTDPLFDGYTIVMSSAPVNPPAPKVGSITEAYLAVNAAQASEFILMRVKTVTPGPHNGFSTTGDYITMSQYVDSVLPTYCANVGTAL